MGFPQNDLNLLGSMYGGRCYTASFSALTEKNELAFHVGSCKEYVLDAVHSTIHKKGSYKEVDLRSARIIVTFDEEGMNRAIDLVNQVENALGIPPSTAERCQGGDETCGMYLVTGDVRWLHAPPMLSLYLLLLRTGGYGKTKSSSLTIEHEIGKPFLEFLGKLGDGKVNHHDSYHWQWGAWAGLKFILEHGDQAIFNKNRDDNWNKSLSCSDIHASYGIMSLGNKSCNRCPEWFKFDKSYTGGK